MFLTTTTMKIFATAVGKIIPSSECYVVHPMTGYILRPALANWRVDNVCIVVPEAVCYILKYNIHLTSLLIFYHVNWIVRDAREIVVRTGGQQ